MFSCIGLKDGSNFPHSLSYQVDKTQYMEESVLFQCISIKW